MFPGICCYILLLLLLCSFIHLFSRSGSHLCTFCQVPALHTCVDFATLHTHTHAGFGHLCTPPFGSFTRSAWFVPGPLPFSFVDSPFVVRSICSRYHVVHSSLILFLVSFDLRCSVVSLPFLRLFSRSRLILPFGSSFLHVPRSRLLRFVLRSTITFVTF